MQEKRRLKALLIPPSALLQQFCGPPNPEAVERYWFVGVPEDAVLQSVHYSPMHAAYVIILSHPSFAVIPVGSEIPAQPAEAEIVRVFPLARVVGARGAKAADGRD